MNLHICNYHMHIYQYIKNYLNQHLIMLSLYHQTFLIVDNHISIEMYIDYFHIFQSMMNWLLYFLIFTLSYMNYILQQMIILNNYLWYLIIYKNQYLIKLNLFYLYNNLFHLIYSYLNKSIDYYYMLNYMLLVFNLYYSMLIYCHINTMYLVLNQL